MYDSKRESDISACKVIFDKIMEKARCCCDLECCEAETAYYMMKIIDHLEKRPYEHWHHNLHDYDYVRKGKYDVGQEGHYGGFVAAGHDQQKSPMSHPHMGAHRPAAQ